MGIAIDKDLMLAGSSLFCQATGLLVEANIQNPAMIALNTNNSFGMP